VCARQDACDGERFRPKNRSKAIRWSAFPKISWALPLNFRRALDGPALLDRRPSDWISAGSVNSGRKITIVETGEEISTKVPDQLLLQGILCKRAVFAVHIEGGSIMAPGVQIDITVMMVTCRSQHLGVRDVRRI